MEEDTFIKENSIIFKKYRIKKKLGEGAFGNVYMGSCIENNELVAIKVEPKNILKPLLETEAYFLYYLKGLGIPEVLSFGRIKSYKILVEPLLGKSLFDVFNERRNRLPLEDICLIAIQIIDRIQWVHSKNIVHRDIKPDNFLIGRKDPNIIYLIDFGLSKKFRSTKTGKHLRFGFTGKLTGTVRFASANALRGGEQSRRDDLESIAYMIIYFMRGKLPWQGVTGNKKMERYLKIYKMKKNVTPEDLCKSLPKQMTEFMRYIKQLDFEQEPNYKFLRNLFNSILKKRNEANDLLLFSWIKLDDFPNLKNPVNPSTRKDSPQSRLYRKIQKNLNSEYTRNHSSDNDSGHKSFQTCTVTMNSNIGIINNFNNKDSKDIDIETSKKKLKYKEGLNTLVTNINQTLDENIVENFEKLPSNDYYINNTMIASGDYIDQGKKKNLTVNEIINYKNGKLKSLSSFSSKKNNTGNVNDKNEEKNKEDLNFKQKKEETEPFKEKQEENIDLNLANKEVPNGIQEKSDDKQNIIFIDNKQNNNIEIKENISTTNKKSSIYNSVNLQANNEIYISFKKNISVNNNQNNNNICNSVRINNNDKINKNNYLERKGYNNSNINNNKIKEKAINNNLLKDKNKVKFDKGNNNLLEQTNEDLKNNYLENRKYNKNNNMLIKKLNDNNINNQNNKEENLANINNQNNINKNLMDYMGKNDNNIFQSHGNSIEKRINIKGSIINSNDEEPNDNNCRDRNLKKVKKIIKSQKKNKMRAYNFESNPSKNTNNLVSSLKECYRKNKNNLNLNNLNANFNIELNGRKIQSNIKNKSSNKNYSYSKKTKDNIQNISPHKKLDLLPKNSDEIQPNENQEFFNNINLNKLNQSNLKKTDIINMNNKNITNNIINDNFNNSTAKKVDRNNNISQENRLNSNSQSNRKNINDNNNKNKIFSNFNKSINSNNKEKNFNPNVRKVIINRVKNMKSINYNSNNQSINQNYKMIINSTSNDMNSFEKNKNRQQKRLNNNVLSNNIINGKNQINMNINNNINNNIIINNNINSNINDNEILYNSKNNFQRIEPVNYIINKRPSHNIRNINSLNNLNQMNVKKRPSYNVQSNNNIPYLTQIEVEKRPSYNTNFNITSFLNNNSSIPIVGGNIKIRKLNSSNNNNFSNLIKMQSNINRNNNIEIRRVDQGDQLYLNNYSNQNNTFRESQLKKNNLINKINLDNNNMNLQPFKSLQKKEPFNTQETFDMGFKKSQIIQNNNYYLTDYEQKNRNISSEIKQKPNLMFDINNNNYTFPNQVNINNPYSNDNLEFNNYKNY